MIYCHVNIICYGVLFCSMWLCFILVYCLLLMFKGDYFEMKGGFLLLNSHFQAIYNHVPMLFDIEQSLQLKYNSVSVSLQCERLLILCLKAAYIHPSTTTTFFSSSPDCCYSAAYFSTDSCTLPFTPCESWCCPQHSTKEGTAGICTHVTSTTGTIPSNSGTQLQQATEENWGGKADQTQLLFMSVISYLFALSLIRWRTGGLYHYILSFPPHFRTRHSCKISTHYAQLCVLCMHRYKRLRNAVLSYTYVHFSCTFLYCVSLWHCRCRDEFEWNWPDIIEVLMWNFPP
jgi:hypothetical protein